MPVNSQAHGIVYGMESHKASWHRARNAVRDNEALIAKLKQELESAQNSREHLSSEEDRFKAELDRYIVQYLNAGVNWCKIEAVDPDKKEQ